MTGENVVWARWKEIDSLLELALDAPPAEREGLLARACGDDRELLTATRRLLHRALSKDDRVNGPVAELLGAALETADPRVPGFRAGDVVGRYRVVGVLGRGGMATVYEAERDDGSYRQRVALKVLRRGLDTDRIVARFLSERQILSDFAHPNVARLLDGGATDDGRPYLVMEKVEGEAITDWADRRNLSTSDRLTLFLQVTDAVEEAHRHLVVHRDLKPANILVNAAGRVKLLDFGIAKLVRPEAPASNLTELGFSPQTRRYASPEQRRGTVVTTSSDVYQLGIILAELLTGGWPFDRETGGIRTGLSGDLDTIVRKALARDPGERFVSVEAMAGDIRRYLEGRPITARPAPWWLRARKWAGRNRWAPPAAALFVLGTASYVGTLVVGIDRLERERNEARIQAERAERIQQFLVELFQSADPFEGEDRSRPDITVAEALDPSVARIRSDLGHDPLAQADLLSAVGSVFFSIDRGDRARLLIEEALDVRRRLGMTASPSYASDLLSLAKTLRSEHWDSASVLLTKAVATLRSSAPSTDPRLAEALSELMWLQLVHLPPADPALGEEALAIYRSAGEAYRLDAAGVLGHLAYVYTSSGRLEEAERAAREALEISLADRGRDHPSSALAAVQLASVFDQQGRYDESIRLYEEALPVLEATAGPTHNQTLTAMNNLATTYQDAGRLPEGAALHRTILRAWLEHAGTEWNRDVGESMQNLAVALKDLGELEEADSLAARAHQILVRTTAEGHYVRALPLLTRAEILLEMDDPAGAAAAAGESLTILEAALPAGHFAVGVARCRLGAAWLRGGARTAEGARLIEAGLEILEAGQGTPSRYLEECALMAEGIPAGS